MGRRQPEKWQEVSYEVEDDGGLLFNVERSSGGIVTGDVRVWGHVLIEGVEYEYDRNIRVRLKKVGG